MRRRFKSAWGAFDFLLAPVSFGAPAMGAEKGPHTLANALGITSEHIWSAPVYQRDAFQNNTDDLIQAFKKFTNEFSSKVFTSLSQKRIPIIFGGDHSLSIGTLTGLMKYLQSQESQNVGIIWIDAHTDIHTPASSTSGNIHGMPLGAACRDNAGYLDYIREACNLKFPFESLCYIGVRDIDPPELEVLQSHNIWYRSAHDVLSRGAESVTKEAIQHLQSSGRNKVHISFDIDVLDPSVAEATATPVQDGISIADARTVLEILLTELDPLVLEIVELNPPRDMNQHSENLLAEITEFALDTLAAKHHG